MAGLAAARYLAERGFQVNVFEARSRIGGRTFTDYSLGVPLDTGAAWIHGTENNPIAELAKKFHVGLKATEFTFRRALLFNAIQQKFSEKIDPFEENFNNVLHQAQQIALASSSDISLGEAIKKAIEQHVTFQMDSAYLSWRLERLSGYMGASVAHLSARYWNQEKILSGGNHLLLDGYGPILNGLANKLSIELNTPIFQIQTSLNGVTLNGLQKTYEADAAIITVPLGVLKKKAITFSPELPIRKQMAIERIGMGLLDKIALKFPKTFWPADVDIISYFSQTYDSSPGFINYAYYFNQPILVGYMSGELGHQMAAKSDQWIIDQTMSLLRKLFGEKIPQPIAAKITHWGLDPFAYGSYSYMHIGASIQDYDALAETAYDRLFFAGEATHRDFSATTHGAYLSGIREAKKICER